MSQNLRRSNSTKAYARAGVDVDLANSIKEGIQRRIASTHRAEVLSQIGGFGGLFRAKFPKMKDPVLVSSIDGVGTKLKVATMLNRHHTVGADLVNHCVNDIAVTGARPLFFLDYIGTGRLDPDVFNQILEGLASACADAGCALIGGETAQMPGIYQNDDYDLVGSIVGVVDRKKIIDGTQIRPGDVLVGLPSSGLHTNGFSLARKILFESLKMRPLDPVPGTKIPLGEALMAVHVNYEPLLRQLAKKITFRGLSHITGGGFLDNIPRILPQGLSAEITLGSWPVPPLFQLLAKASGVPPEEWFQVFNMGVGMVAIVRPNDAHEIIRRTTAWPIGRVVRGSGQVILSGSVDF